MSSPVLPPYVHLNTLTIHIHLAGQSMHQISHLGPETQQAHCTVKGAGHSPLANTIRTCILQHSTPPRLENDKAQTNSAELRVICNQRNRAYASGLLNRLYRAVS